MGDHTISCTHTYTHTHTHTHTHTTNTLMPKVGCTCVAILGVALFLRGLTAGFLSCPLGHGVDDGREGGREAGGREAGGREAGGSEGDGLARLMCWRCTPSTIGHIHLSTICHIMWR